jgi:hypothetical protein
VRRLTSVYWNDPEDRRAVPGVTVSTSFRQILRRLDRWTLVVFNPRLPADRRR